MDREEDETQTHDLRIEQAERETREHELLEHSDLPDEADQHERRRDKAAYLKEKLAERERAEQEAPDE
jgi:hypothetical protein